MRKKIGLALGAGSTKGFAHIGVLEVFAENGVPIDMISGCSMGAIIGSAYAVGCDMYMLEKYVYSLDLRRYIDIRNPFTGGFIRGQSLQEILKVFTHGKTFAQTNIPFCCVAVDAACGRLDVLEEGLLHEAVRASMSIPAIFEPYTFRGKTYIDGGVLDRVPCKALRDRGMDIVIGVDVGYHGGETDVSGMSAYQLMNHSIHIMQWQINRMWQEDAELMLMPEVPYMRGYFQMDRVRECVEEGRRAALAALPEVRKLLSLSRERESNQRESVP